MICLLLVVTAILAIRRHGAELTDAARELRTVDLLLAKDTGRALQSVTLVLDAIAEQLPRVGSDTDVEKRLASIEVHQMLRTRAAGLPQLDALSLVAADGRVLNFSRGWPVPSIRIDDRDYFRFLREHPMPTPYLTEPVINRGSGTPTVYLAKRLDAPDGTFEGLLLGAIQLDYFERLYLSLHLEPGNSIGLWRGDDVLLASDANADSEPDSAPTRLPAGSQPRLSLSDGDTGVWSLGSETGPSRLVASTAVEGFPLHINVGRRAAVILQDWRREILAIGGFVLVSIGCVLAMMWALARRFRAYEAVQAASEERERAILARQEVEGALRQAQKMEAVGHLTGQLLAFARREAVQPTTFDVVANVSGIGQMVDRLTGPRVEVVTELPSEPCYVHADPNQFDTAIVNLAVNARDAMPDGGRLSITIRTVAALPTTPGADRQGGPYVAVAVADTGMGIAPEVQNRIFEPFFTTKAAGQGTGLGLAQVIGFAHQSGGDVTLNSSLGIGSTFTLHLPLREAEAPASSRTGRVGPATGGGARVLLVDDDEEVARVTAQLMRELKYFAVIAGDAVEALDMLDEDRGGFRLVVTDMVMPGMDGVTLAHTVRDLHPDVPVLLMTGFGALTDQNPSGFPVLPKPFGLEDLACALADALAAGPPPREPTPIADTGRRTGTRSA